jgi:hypothetical protein
MNGMEGIPCYKAERQSLVVSNTDSYFGGAGLKSRPGNRLSCLRLFKRFRSVREKMWKATVSLVMLCVLYLRLSVRQRGTMRHPLGGFSWNFTLGIFNKLVHQTPVQLKPKKKITGTLQEDLHTSTLLDFIIECFLCRAIWGLRNSWQAKGSNRDSVSFEVRYEA